MEKEYRTLCDVFQDMDNCPPHIFIDNLNEEICVSPGKFKELVLKTLHLLRNRGVAEGDEVFFQVNRNLEFVQLFWACVLGKMLPVPYALQKTKANVFKILKELNNPYIVTNQKSATQYTELMNELEDEKIKNPIIILDEADNFDSNTEIAVPKETDIAFIQYSSGSTSKPKGVIVTHRNILLSVASTHKAMKIGTNDVFENWLPLSHSFGIIATYLMPLISHCPFYILPPDLFVTQPLFYLKKMSEYHATITALPNFAMKHILKNIDYVKEATIDLSDLRIIIDGAEPVSTEVCEEFNRRMKCYGLRETTVRPSYGLSEATLVVSTAREEEKYVEVKVVRDYFQIGKKVTETGKNDRAIYLAEVGQGINECAIKIVDEYNREVGDRVVGIVCLKGEVITQGYYNNPKITSEVIDADGWLNTGDLGFMRDGKLVLTGRKKDVIIIKGENYFSYDIENVCQQVFMDNVNRVAICNVYNAAVSREQIICFMEYKDAIDRFKEIALKVKKHVLRKMGIGIAVVIPIEQIPLTDSGKVRRFELQNQFEEGRFDELMDRMAAL